MRQLTALVLLTVARLAWSAPDTDELADRFARRLEQFPVLRAEFVQEKQMAAFKKPLLTRGQLVFVHGQGILWRIENPIKLTLVLTDDRIVEISEDGRVQARTARDVPGLAQIGQIFRALLTARTGTLKEVFTIAPEGKAEAWRLTLTPKPGPAQQLMRQIQLQGSRHVDRILIDEANGDVTTIALRNATEGAAPSADERAQFGVR